MNNLTVKVESFRRKRSSSLFGFCTVLIPELHLRIIDATVHESHRKRWVGLPAKPQISREGVVRRDERGRPAYSPVLKFIDKPTRDAFSARAIAASLETFPHAFDDEVAA